MFHSKRWISWRSIHGSFEFLLDIIAVQVNVEHLWHYMGWAWGSMRYMEIPWLIRDTWILEGVMYASHRIHGWCIYLYSRGHSWIHDPQTQGGRGSWWSRRTGGGQGFSNCWKGWKRNQPRKLTQKGSWGFGRIFSGKSRWNYHDFGPKWWGIYHINWCSIYFINTFLRTTPTVNVHTIYT